MFRRLSLVSSFALALMAGGALFLPQSAQAQTAPTCGGNVQPTCGTTVPFDGTQSLVGNVTSTVTVDGSTITVTPTPTDGSPAQVTASSVSSLSTGIGNSLSYKVQNELQLVGQAAQDMFGTVAAYNTVTTTSAVPGLVSSITAAYGNTAQAETCCGGMDIGVTQRVTGGSVLADGIVTTAPGLGTLSMTSTSNGNAIGVSSVNGTINLRGIQDNVAGIFASSQGQVCCNTASISVTSTAAANSSASGSTNSTVYSVNTQTNSGQVLSGASHVTNNGTAISSLTQATGNSVYASNQWGYTQVEATQSNTAQIRGVANLTANNFITSASVGTTATANSILLSSQGSDGTLVGAQTNGVGGTVVAEVYLDGSSTSGGVAQASGTATGNAMTGYACSGCGTSAVKLEGHYDQTNSANVSALVSVGGNLPTSTTGGIVASGTAIGNVATFIAQSK